ncbi:Pvc16 family protein [Burkholderia pyrrocinia]
MVTSKPRTDTKLPEERGGKEKQTHEDQTILFLNSAIESNIKNFTSSKGDIRIRFDIPDKSDPPDVPMLYVFLYDIQEDLEIRQGQLRLYDASTGKFNPGHVHVRCCYLITYWESSKLVNTNMGPRSQSMQVMNLVLNSLLNLELKLHDEHQTEISVPIFKRVIAPNERLSSLGNFWQSLGDKPRLCLNFAVTVPISLKAPKEDVAPITSVTEVVVALDGTSGASSPAEQVSTQLRKKLVEALKIAAGNLNPRPDEKIMKAELNTLEVACVLASNGTLPTTGASPDKGPWDVQVSGILDKRLESTAERTIKAWESKDAISDTSIREAKSGVAYVDFQKTTHSS